MPDKSQPKPQPTEQQLARAARELLELSSCWLVNLSNVGGEWTLIVTPIAGQHGNRTHEYVSTDLLRLLNHAWAGAPDGRV